MFTNPCVCRESVLGLFSEGESLLPNLAPLPRVQEGAADAGENWRVALQTDSDQTVQFKSEAEHDQHQQDQQHSAPALSLPDASVKVPLGRDILPIEGHRAEIIGSIDSGMVTCIHGETGCGKSSMVS